ncbi:MAG TPA: DUF3710 domain-containing protein [Jatrophihabitantaceae bacterium]
MALGRKPKRSRENVERAKLDATPPWETRIRDEPNTTTGPWDERDAPEDEVARADLGALRIPVGTGLDLQVEVNEAQQVVSATLASPQGSMQLGLFAAPRNEGIWDEVRAEIADSLKGQRGNPAERANGAFGTELTGTIPADGGRVPVRFIGVDGPRWFLRAMLVGPPSDPAKGKRFEDALRNVIVVRGNDPLPVRDPVPLTLPKDVVLPPELQTGEDDA